MKRTSELKFLKSIISSELVLNKSTNSNFKNVYALNKDIKQMLRILRFSLKTESNLLYFWLDNKYLLNLFKSLVDPKFDTSKQEICFDTNLPLLKKNFYCSFVLTLGSLSCNEKEFLNKLRLNRILLAAKVSGIEEKNSFGVYKINSDIDNLKSVCFYIVVLNHVLQSRKNI